MRSVPEIEEQRNHISSIIINKQFTEMDKLSHSCELSKWSIFFITELLII